MDCFVESLATCTVNDLVCNPWKDWVPGLDIGPEAPHIRQEQLRAYLAPRWGQAKYIVLAEAIGYQGGRFSGIAITCERMLLGHHGRIQPAMILPDGQAQRTSDPASPLLTQQTQRDKGFNEPTDTVVWEALLDNGLSPYEALLWNIFPFHPHQAGKLLSNRTPDAAELALGWTFTAQLLAANPQAQLVAVGRKAAETLAQFGVTAPALRHPANGGAGLYKQQFTALVQQSS